MHPVPLMFLLFIVLAVITRLIAGSMDGDRVERYVRERGGRLLTKEWAPFGRGWFGEKESRIYEITYLDRDGHTHRATCKTSLWSGVYFTEDSIIAHAKRDEPVVRGIPAGSTDLAEENRRLREEIERLRRGQA